MKQKILTTLYKKKRRLNAKVLKCMNDKLLIRHKQWSWNMKKWSVRTVIAGSILYVNRYSGLGILKVKILCCKIKLELNFI